MLLLNNTAIIAESALQRQSCHADKLSTEVVGGVDRLTGRTPRRYRGSRGVGRRSERGMGWVGVGDGGGGGVERSIEAVRRWKEGDGRWRQEGGGVFPMVLVNHRAPTYCMVTACFHRYDSIRVPTHCLTAACFCRVGITKRHSIHSLSDHWKLPSVLLTHRATVAQPALQRQSCHTKEASKEGVGGVERIAGRTRR